jgi:hypothetical protein
MSATAVLAAVGMAIGRNVYFQRKRGFIGRANLYAIVFAARGERKSVTFRPALLPFYSWMKKKDPAYKQKIKEYRRNLALMQNLETALSKPGLKGNKRQEFEEELTMLEHEIGEMPRNPWFLADDATPEALFKLMSETGGTAGIFSDDARLMVKMLLGNVYSNSGEGREEFLLRPYDGEQPLIRRRVGTGDDHIDRPCIGMLLMLQTDFLKKSERPYRFLTAVWLHDVSFVILKAGSANVMKMAICSGRTMITKSHWRLRKSIML